MNCPLCTSAGNSEFFRDIKRCYQRCHQCELVFVPPEFWLDQTAEQQYYLLHQNNPDDHEYRRFLGRLTTPLLERIPANSLGLDYGCGPGPTIQSILAEAGHVVVNYDPLFCSAASALQRQYQFISCTEVLEHMHQPAAELRKLRALLAPGGILAIMTQALPAKAGFAQWHYIRDPTHICFYSAASFRWIGEELAMQLEQIASGVYFLTRQQ